MHVWLIRELASSVLHSPSVLQWTVTSLYSLVQKKFTEQLHVMSCQRQPAHNILAFSSPTPFQKLGWRIESAWWDVLLFSDFPKAFCSVSVAALVPCQQKPQKCTRLLGKHILRSLTEEKFWLVILFKPYIVLCIHWAMSSLCRLPFATCHE